MTMTTTISPRAPSLGTKLRVLARDIKLSHTIFAMPWAILATFVAANGWPRPGQFGLIVLCMVTARTVAMSANRLLDAQLDAINPRTAQRAIPSGRLSRAFVAMILAMCAATFVLTTALFRVFYANPWPLILALPVLVFVAAYPLLKRFTRLCHYYLGAALALAPVCAWVAISGTLALPPLIMAGAVLLWTAGFDIIYACQDYESDRQTGVVSIPAKLGIAAALWGARAPHALCAGLLLLLGRLTPQFGPLYFIGAAAAIALLIVEHSLVKAHDLSKANVAFFTVNGIISLLLGTLGILDVLI
jgi:4-hydroxybenzoate polyprenyltransferase